MKTFIRYLTLAVLLLFTHQCGVNDQAGSGSQTTNNSNCIGRIYNNDSTPAQGAQVLLVPNDYIPLSSSEALICTTVTDENGDYSFLISESGYYTITAEKGNTSCKQDSVPIQANAQTIAGNDTLEASGYLTGRVLMKPGDDPLSPIILILGTNIFTTPYDSTGTFSTPPLPAGDFTIRIFTTENGYGTVDTTVTIASGDTTKCDITLPSTTSLSVSDFAVTFDSASMHTTLSWSFEDTTSIKLFTLSRSIRGTTDTMFTLDRSQNSFVDDVIDCEGDTVEYYLSVIDNNSKERFRTVSPKIIPTSTIQLTRELDLFEKNLDFMDMEARVKSLFTMIFLDGGPTLHIDNDDNIYITFRHGIIKTDPDGSIIAYFIPESEFFGSPYLQTDDSDNFYWIYGPEGKTVLVKLNDNLKVQNEFVIPDSIALIMNHDFSLVVSGGGTVFLKGNYPSVGGTHILVLDNNFTIIDDYQTENQNEQHSCSRFGDIFIIHETAGAPDYLDLLCYYDNNLNQIFRLYETALPDSNSRFFGGPFGLLVTLNQSISSLHPLITMMDTTGHLFGRKLLTDIISKNEKVHIDFDSEGKIHFDNNGNFYCLGIDWSDLSVDFPEGVQFRVLRYSLVTSRPNTINATSTYPKDIQSW